MQVTDQDEALDLEVRRTSGRAHLRANRIEDAMAVFAGILRDYPGDAESLAALGDLFLESGNSSTAAQLYQRVIQQKKGDPQIEERLQLAQSEIKLSPNNDPGPVALHPTVIDRHKKVLGQPTPAIANQAAFSAKVLILTAAPENPPARIVLLAESIDILGGSAALASAYPDDPNHWPDVVIASNPYPHAGLMAGLAASAAAHRPILVDLTVDPHEIAADHADYDTYGMSSPDTTHAYPAMLQLASMITVPSRSLMTALKAKGHPVRLVPDGWSKSNPLLASRPGRRNRLNLGWIGKPGQYADVADIRRVIIRILREFPVTRLVISGDQSVYSMFEDIPRSKRQFYPLPPASEFPDLLNQIDLLIKPLRDIPYNRTFSDQLLVAACAQGIPWVASPIPAVIDWEIGGVIVHNIDAWHSTLSNLIINQDLRERLGREGQQRAQGREINHLKIAWLNAFNQVLNSRPTISP